MRPPSSLRHWRAAAHDLPPGMWRLVDHVQLRSDLTKRTTVLERMQRCYELDVSAAKAELAAE